jgi:hypothetical protein
MLERAHTEAAAGRAATQAGNGRTSQDEAQDAEVDADQGKVLIKLH